MPGQIDQADRVWTGQSGPAAPAGIAPVRRITISPGRLHCPRLFSTPFTKCAEEPINRLFRTFGDNSENARYLIVNWDRADGPQARQTLLTLLPTPIFSSLHQICGRAG